MPRRRIHFVDNSTAARLHSERLCIAIHIRRPESVFKIAVLFKQRFAGLVNFHPITIGTA